LSSAGTGRAITLVRVVQAVDITPEPDDDERAAILAALAAEAEEGTAVSAWAAALLPVRHADDDSP
jgi:hypothetical protein